MDNTCNEKLNWKQMDYVVNHVESIDKLWDGQEGSCWVSVPTLLKLKKTHCLEEEKVIIPNSVHYKLTYIEILIYKCSVSKPYL